MNKVILILFILLLVPKSLALGDKVFEDWVYSKNTITLDEKEFYFKLGTEGSTLLVISDEKSVTISIEDCEDIDIIRKVCFNESYYEGSGESGNRAYIIIYYKKPRLNITRKIDNNILIVGEEAEFTVDIYNKGELDADDVSYLDIFPENVVVKTSSGCQHTGSKVYYNGDVLAGSYVSCRYTIKTTAPVDSNTIASVTYSDSFTDVTNYSSAIRLYSTEILRVNTSVDNSTMQIDETTYFRMNITNVGEQEVEIGSLVVNIPAGLQVLSDNMVKINERNYKWSGGLDDNESKLIVFKLKAVKLKGSEILANIEYKVDNERYEINNIKESVFVEDRGVTLDSNIDDGQRIDANTEQTISIYVRNENNYSDIKNLILRLNSTLFPYDEYKLSTLGEEARAKVASVTLKMPDVESTQTYKFTANLTYQTEYGDTNSEKIERTIIVEPIKKLIITKIMSPSTLDEGKEATVTVQIKNDRNTRIDDISVSEIFHGNVGQRGTTSTVIENISEGQTVTAYTYTVKGPDVINETIYNVTTEAKYTKDGQDYLFTKVLNIKVIPKKLKVTVSKSVSDEDVYIGEVVKVRYKIENEEEEAAKNLRLVFTDNQKVDTINNYEFFVERLNPGEDIVIEKEQIRPKVVEDKMVVGTSILYYQDMQGAQFSTVSSSLTMKVQSTYIQGPVIWLEKKSNLYDIQRADEIEITITARNIGDEATDVLIIDGDNSWNKQIHPNKEEIIQYKTRYYEPGEYTLPKVYGYYDYLGNEYRATSDVIKIKVTDVNIPVEEKKEEVVVQEPAEEELEEKPIIKKENIFVRLWRTILEVFS